MRSVPAPHQASSPSSRGGWRDRPVGTWIVAGLFGVSGVGHLVRPEAYVALMPPWLGPPIPWIVASGVVELTCAAGLLTRQRWAPRATAATLVIIWVGNIYYAVDVTTRESASLGLLAAAWLRLPLQVPLIIWAWRSPVRPVSPPPG